MMTPPSPRTLDTSSDKARTLSHVANQDLLHEGYFKQSELRSDFACPPDAISSVRLSISLRAI
jgi:hypothetical protein